MEDFLKEIEAAHAAALYRLSLFGALALPDICGALRFVDGRASRDRFLAWYNEFVLPIYDTLSAEEAYDWRCSSLHQGTSVPQNKENKDYTRVIFSINPRLHTNIKRHSHPDNDEIFIHADLRSFIPAVVLAARKFCDVSKGSETFEKNITNFIKYYPNGLAHAKFALFA